MTPYHRDSWHFLAHSKSIFVTKTQKNTIDVKEYLRVLLHLLLRNSIVERVFIACDGDVIQSVFSNVQHHFPGIAVKWYHLFILQKGNCIHAKCKMHPVAPRSRSFWQCIWARMCDCVCLFCYPTSPWHCHLINFGQAHGEKWQAPLWPPWPGPQPYRSSTIFLFSAHHFEIQSSA